MAVVVAQVVAHSTMDREVRVQFPLLLGAGLFSLISFSSISWIRSLVEVQLLVFNFSKKMKSLAVQLEVRQAQYALNEIKKYFCANLRVAFFHLWAISELFPFFQGLLPRSRRVRSRSWRLGRRESWALFPALDVRRVAGNRPLLQNWSRVQVQAKVTIR